MFLLLDNDTLLVVIEWYFVRLNVYLTFSYDELSGTFSDMISNWLPQALALAVNGSFYSLALGLGILGKSYICKFFALRAELLSFCILWRADCFRALEPLFMKIVLPSLIKPSLRLSSRASEFWFWSEALVSELLQSILRCYLVLIIRLETLRVYWTGNSADAC